MVIDKDADTNVYSYVQENGPFRVSTTCHSIVAPDLLPRERTDQSSYHPYIRHGFPGYCPSKHPYAWEPGSSNVDLSTTGPSKPSSNGEPSWAYSHFPPCHPITYNHLRTDPNEMQPSRYQEYHQPDPVFSMHWMPIEPTDGPARISTVAPCHDQPVKDMVYYDVYPPIIDERSSNARSLSRIDAGKEGKKMTRAEFQKDHTAGTRSDYTGHYIYERQPEKCEPHSSHGEPNMVSNLHHTHDIDLASKGKPLDFPAEQSQPFWVPMDEDHPYIQLPYRLISPMQNRSELPNLHGPLPVISHPNHAHEANFDESRNKQPQMAAEQDRRSNLRRRDEYRFRLSYGLIPLLQDRVADSRSAHGEPHIPPHPLYGPEVYHESMKMQPKLPVEVGGNHSFEQTPCDPIPQLKRIAGPVKVRTPSRKNKPTQRRTSSAPERKGVYSTISQGERSEPVNCHLSFNISHPTDEHSPARRVDSGNQVADAISELTDDHRPSGLYTYSDRSDSGLSRPVSHPSNNTGDCANQHAHGNTCHSLRSSPVSRVRDHLPYPLDTCFNQSRPGDKWRLALEELLRHLRISFDMIHRYNDAELEEVLMSLCEQVLYSVERGGSKGGVTSITCLINDCAKQFGKHNVARNFAHHLMKEHWQLSLFICNDTGCGSAFAWSDDRTRHEKDQHNFVYESQS
ncbi:hypothetical protein M408DRAFT_22245 [Serendipita vermifera MAFF 305830]|uniref:C2H2-type domain-containing protein n=1 Tax=Serendipita vermifera MAFF 305830 TaxID=933852 RepID=A0A0C3B0C0_SERVB|nr:hypothetical protein M408DRAFT_22245 [Serendipita vermifera MAFF 305830]